MFRRADSALPAYHAWRSSLLISLLERNAVRHTACALLIYKMWWRKPLDIAERTLIPGYQTQLLLAHTWMSSRVSAKGLKSHGFQGRLRDEFDGLWIYQQPRNDDLELENSHSSNTRLNVQEEDTNAASPSTSAPFKNGLDPYLYVMSYRHYASDDPLTWRYRIINWLHSRSTSPTSV